MYCLYLSLLFGIPVSLRGPSEVFRHAFVDCLDGTHMEPKGSVLILYMASKSDLLCLGRDKELSERKAEHFFSLLCLAVSHYFSVSVSPWRLANLQQK